MAEILYSMQEALGSIPSITHELLLYYYVSFITTIMTFIIIYFLDNYRKGICYLGIMDPVYNPRNWEV